MHALGARPAKIALLNGLSKLVSHRVFCGDDHLVPAARLVKPLADPFLALATVVRISSVDEIAAQVVECVEELEGAFFGEFAKSGLP